MTDPHLAHSADTSILIFFPVVWAASIADNLSFFIRLHALHRFGGFFRSLSRKNSCSPAVQMNSRAQSIHGIARSSKKDDLSRSALGVAEMSPNSSPGITGHPPDPSTYYFR